MLPFWHLKHALKILLGHYDSPSATGQVSHFEALSSALAGTIGMANIAGVAVAIQTGGPGAIFWMWVCAAVGIATKFFTCSLAIQFRGPDSRGEIQGGPMYVILYGLGKRWKPLAVLFAFCALCGTLPMFQVNQLVRIARETVAMPLGWVTEASDAWTFNLALGIVVAIAAGSVQIGGIKRVGSVAAKMVPAMVLLYIACATVILATNLSSLPAALALIVKDAFTGEAVAGGAVWAVIVTGVRRAAFSNEAGVGSEALAHGAAKTDEPVREGLVAMLGPIIDTLIICTATALIILSTGTWTNTEAEGVSVTLASFEQVLPGIGTYALFVCTIFFGFSTTLSCGYYGEKSLGFLIGAERQHLYRYIYVASILISSVTSVTAVLEFIDGMYGLMSIPTMTSSLILAPLVMKEARRYFKTMEAGAD
jgi:AGCS family alanine or glycine:cation symporter